MTAHRVLQHSGAWPSACGQERRRQGAQRSVIAMIITQNYLTARTACPSAGAVVLCRSSSSYPVYSAHKSL